jgi:hypothetical protein
MAGRARLENDNLTPVHELLIKNNYILMKSTPKFVLYENCITGKHITLDISGFTGEETLFTIAWWHVNNDIDTFKISVSVPICGDDHTYYKTVFYSYEKTFEYLKYHFEHMDYKLFFRNHVLKELACEKTIENDGAGAGDWDYELGMAPNSTSNPICIYNSMIGDDWIIRNVQCFTIPYVYSCILLI